MKLSQMSGVVVLLFSGVANAIPAFPGAEGGGAEAKGGRGGVVIEVTNINDSGPGSLRACVQASGPRTCVFRVSGSINLFSPLTISNPFITIAGQTAPGGGIQLRAAGPAQLVTPNTNDIIIRYLKVRHGFNSGCGNEGCGANIQGFDANNMIIDHVTSQWNQDESIGFYQDSALPVIKNITVQWSIIAEGINNTAEPHSTGLFYGTNAGRSNGMTNLDMHHNLTMNNSHRNPLFRGKNGRIVSNLFYNQNFYVNQIQGGAVVDIIGNKYRHGPLNTAQHEITVVPNCGSFCATGTPSIHVLGNLGYNQPNPAANQQVLCNAVNGENGPETGPCSGAWFRATAQANTAVPITSESVAGLDNVVLPTVGASRRLDCAGAWVMNRDTQETKLINQYNTNTGTNTLHTTESGYGGFPTIAAGTPCADADHDGMPDQYEVIKSGTPTGYSHLADADSDGFLNLEEYLSGGETGATPPPEGQKFEVNDRVVVTSSTINVRSTPGGTLVGTQPMNAQGTVTAGPTGTTNGVTWYNINYDTGTDGWSGQDNLVPLVNADSAPTVSITAPPGGATVAGSAFEITGVASDNTAVVGYQLKLDGANLGAEDTTGSGTYSFMWDTTTAANGQHVLTAVARDGTGNTTTSAEVIVTVNNGAGDGVVIGEQTILGSNDVVTNNEVFALPFSLAQTAVIQSLSIYIQTATGGVRMALYDATGASGGPGALIAETAGVTAPTAGWHTQAVISPISVAAGTYWLAFNTSSSVTLRASATGGTTKRDTGFTYGAMPATFSIDATTTFRWSIYATFTTAGDTTPPATAITAPAPGNISGASVSVTASASDAVGVAGVSFHLVPPGGAPDATNIIGVEDTTSTYGVTLDTTTRVNGPYNIHSVARDDAGNMTISAPVAVTVANTIATPSGLGFVREAP